VAEKALLDRETLSELLNEIGKRLEGRAEHATLYVFGGAAMMLHGLRQGMTEDIDTYSLSHPSVVGIQQEMTREFGLAPGWLNTAGSGFVTGPDSDSTLVVMTFGALTVQVASPRNLLAHKLTALRPKDLQDLDRLLRVNNITHAAEASALVAELYDVDNAVPRIDLADIESWTQGWLERNSS
jgi:hypothetical protein